MELKNIRLQVENCWSKLISNPWFYIHIYSKNILNQNQIFWYVLYGRTSIWQREWSYHHSCLQKASTKRAIFSLVMGPFWLAAQTGSCPSLRSLPKIWDWPKPWLWSIELDRAFFGAAPAKQWAVQEDEPIWRP